MRTRSAHRDNQEITPLALTVLRSAGKKRRGKYRVSFFKKLTDSTGHPFDVCQGVVEVHSDRKSRAVRKARLRFAGVKNVVVWSLRADYEKVQLIADRERVSNATFPLGLGTLDYLFRLS